MKRKLSTGQRERIPSQKTEKWFSASVVFSLWRRNNAGTRQEANGWCDFSLKQDLFSLLAEKGAKLIGAADLTGIVSNEMQTGVSVAVPIPKSIVEDLKTAPTQAYYEAYSSMNEKLYEMV